MSQETKQLKKKTTSKKTTEETNQLQSEKSQNQQIQQLQDTSKSQNEEFFQFFEKFFADQSSKNIQFALVDNNEPQGQSMLISMTLNSKEKEGCFLQTKSYIGKNFSELFLKAFFDIVSEREKENILKDDESVKEQIFNLALKIDVEFHGNWFTVERLAKKQNLKNEQVKTQIKLLEIHNLLATQQARSGGLEHKIILTDENRLKFFKIKLSNLNAEYDKIKQDTEKEIQKLQQKLIS